MRRSLVFAGTVAAIVAMPLGVSGQETKLKTQPKAVTQPAPSSAPAAPAKATTNPTAAQPAASAPRSADETALRQTCETYVAAFNQANAKTVVDHYTSDAEFIDESCHLIQGKAAIEESLKAFFAANPDCKIALNITSIRTIGPGVAIEDGTSIVTRSKNAEPINSLYTVVHLKNGGKWQVASVRETALKPDKPHRAQLKQLDWMLGDWVHEGTDAVVFFSCELADKGNFLIRNFTIQIAGQEAMTGSQRIGWDAQASKLKSWIFDSDGGHSEGYWHRDGDTWVLKMTGVTADGRSASSTSVYSFLNEHTMTFQSVDHEVAGVEMPDGPKVKIVRHAPQPE